MPPVTTRLINLGPPNRKLWNCFTSKRSQLRGNQQLPVGYDFTCLFFDGFGPKCFAEIDLKKKKGPPKKNKSDDSVFFFEGTNGAEEKNEGYQSGICVRFQIGQRETRSEELRWLSFQSELRHDIYHSMSNSAYTGFFNRILLQVNGVSGKPPCTGRQ